MASILRIPMQNVIAAAACLLLAASGRAQAPLTYAEFVERDFPFITTTVAADEIDGFTPHYNWAVRAVVVRLGAEAYFAFDPDLLRMAITWEGEFLSMATMAQVSYHRLDKGNATPVVLGAPIAATGMYPGWMATVRYEDPRVPGPAADDPGRGPLPRKMGAYRGLYVHGDDVVLSYRVGNTNIYEQPGLLADGTVRLVTRTFDIGAAQTALTLVAAEIPGEVDALSRSDEVIIDHGNGTVTAVFADEGLSLDDGRYVTYRHAASDRTTRVRVAVFRGPRSDLDRARRLNGRPVEMADGFREGGPARWLDALTTVVDVSPDTSAFVFDHVALPDPNPWRRNVRPADLAFFEDGRAAVVTFDGDVWIVDGLDGRAPSWRRFASGLYEPLAAEIVGGALYVYGREGIVRLHDLDSDGEADYYEAFAPGIIQSTISREWPFDLVARPEGGFFASQGGALNAGPTRGRTAVAPGFVAGSPHNGTVVEVSADGTHVRRHATGFRGPYLGIHPEAGLLTASDQQGNFVPSTPIYIVEEGGYYGVPPTAHLDPPLPKANPPLTWIPHRIDPSATGQVWITSDGNGPLSGHLVGLSYGRSGLYRVYIDSLASPVQGAVAALPDDGRSPTLKGTMNPADGRLYVAGFQVWGTTADKLASLRRLRYTGLASDLPDEARAGRQGVLLTFDGPVTRPEASNIRVRRWNYLRTSNYGSGHYRLDGSEGEEALPIAGLHLSDDGRALLIVLPDMGQVMQMSVSFDLQRSSGEAIFGSVYLTVNDAGPIELDEYGLAGAPWERDLEHVEAAAAVDQGEPVEPTALRGRHLFHEVGCAACHSTDRARAGDLGPALGGLFGTVRELASGEAVPADAAYIRRSILDPAEDVVAGFDQEMPSFRGILSAGDIESVILYIKSLRDDSHE